MIITSTSTVVSTVRHKLTGWLESGAGGYGGDFLGWNRKSPQVEDLTQEVRSSVNSAFLFSPVLSTWVPSGPKYFLQEEAYQLAKPRWFPLVGNLPLPWLSLKKQEDRTQDDLSSNPRWRVYLVGTIESLGWYVREQREQEQEQFAYSTVKLVPQSVVELLAWLGRQSRVEPEPLQLYNRLLWSPSTLPFPFISGGEVFVVADETGTFPVKDSTATFTVTGSIITFQVKDL